MTKFPGLLFAVFFTVISVLVSADDHGVSFLFPIAGLTLSHNDTVNVTYTSDFPVPLLYTFCKNSTANTSVTELHENVAAYNGSELVRLKWPDISSCYWDLRPNTSHHLGADSPTISVLVRERPVPSTVGLAQVTATGAAEIGSASPDSGLSTGAKAGIGIGVALGVILVAAIAGFFLMRRRRRETKVASPNDVPPEYPVETKSDNQNGQGDVYQEVERPKPQEMETETDTTHTHELSSESRNELPGHEVRYELR